MRLELGSSCGSSRPPLLRWGDVIGVLLLTSVLSACIMAAKRQAERDVHSQDGLRAVASFDLRCEPADLGLRLLVGEHWNGVGSQAVVEGCGRSGRYVLARGAGWVLDAAHERTDPPSPPPPS